MNSIIKTHAYTVFFILFIIYLWYSLLELFANLFRSSIEISKIQIYFIEPKKQVCDFPESKSFSLRLCPVQVCTKVKIGNLSRQIADNGRWLLFAPQFNNISCQNTHSFQNVPELSCLPFLRGESRHKLCNVNFVFFNHVVSE